MSTKTEKQPIIAFTLDFETGGLKCTESACTQIAVHATRIDTFERVGSYVKYIKPYPKKQLAGTPKTRKVLVSKYENEAEELMEYSDIAFEVSGITMDKLYEVGEDIQDVAQGLLDFIIEHTPKKTNKALKPFLIGQNVAFDIGFLMQLMTYAGLQKELSKVLRGSNDFYGNFQPLAIDTILLAQLSLSHIQTVDSYKLELICENLGVELTDAHDADADVAATTDVVRVLTQRMRDPNASGEFELKAYKTEKTRKHFKI